MSKQFKIKMIASIIMGIAGGILAKVYFADPSGFKFSENLTYFFLIASMIFLIVAYSGKKASSL